jgi:hypothetical protein
MKIDLTLDYQTILGRHSPRNEKATVYSAMVNMVYDFILESANADLIEKQEA